MKKIVTVILLATLLLGCTTALAFAESDEQYVQGLATQHEKVLACECVIYKRACLIAIKTEKFTTKSEYDSYVDELVEQIKDNCEVDYVYVSRSPKLMSKLAELNKLDKDKRDEAIEEMIQKYLNGRDHDRGPIMPRFLDRA